ncbi:MAG: DUF1905 domain-containing protein, partial [Anaerolineae bacterium]|nr:DUF1905 domain-containing protein [Anaerolineae bacterium]
NSKTDRRYSTVNASLQQGSSRCWMSRAKPNTVAAYGDVFMLPLSKEHREAASVQAGDEVAVTLELDTEPRTVDVPDDLMVA